MPVSSGTAANGLSLAAVTPPWGVVFCHRLAHIVRDEWCAPEFFTGGARLLGVEGAGAKISPDELDAQVRLTTHAGRPSTLSVTQATEAGRSTRSTRCARSSMSRAATGCACRWTGRVLPTPW